jgi:iron complex transport system ATP-binding protein
MLKSKSLSFRIGQNWCIQDISLDFYPGALYGILGPNGSGKSTLLKTLSGILKPTIGQVLWNNENLLEKDRRKISQTISLVPQNQQTFFAFTVFDFVTMGRYSHDNHRHVKDERDIVEWAMGTVNVCHLSQRLMTELSSGEKQRVYIARSLATESPVLLLDEPTSYLDIRHQLGIWKLLKNLVNQNKIIIITMHDLSATARFCDQVAVLDYGKNIAKGTVNEVMHPHLLREVFGVIENTDPFAFSFDLAPSFTDCI